MKGLSGLVPRRVPGEEARTRDNMGYVYCVVCHNAVHISDGTLYVAI